MKLEALIQRNSLTIGGALFLGTSVPIISLFDFLQDDQTLETFLDHFPSITRKQASAVLTVSRDLLLDASLDLDSDGSQASLESHSSETPNLVCKYCKDPIYALNRGSGYLHAYTGAAECIPTGSSTIEARATAYDDYQTYPAFRAELITEMAKCVHSYSDTDSPEQVLEMILADARHFADAERLNFDDYYRRSYHLYLENSTETRR